MRLIGTIKNIEFGEKVNFIEAEFKSAGSDGRVYFDSLNLPIKPINTPPEILCLIKQATPVTFVLSFKISIYNGKRYNQITCWAIEL